MTVVEVWDGYVHHRWAIQPLQIGIDDGYFNVFEGSDRDIRDDIGGIEDFKNEYTGAVFYDFLEDVNIKPGLNLEDFISSIKDQLP